jgi:signal transduction histidine kinase
VKKKKIVNTAKPARTRRVTKSKMPRVYDKNYVRFLEKLALSSPNLVYVFDLVKQQNVYANRVLSASYSISDQHANALTRSGLETLMHPDDATKITYWHSRWATVADGQVLRTDFRMLVNGEMRLFSARETVFKRNKAGQVVQFMGIAVDVTDQEESNEQLLVQNARLAAIAHDLKFKNEQLQEFAHVVSHNLRAPAKNIMVITDFLQQPHTAEEQKTFHDLLKKTATSMVQTLTELGELLKAKDNNELERQQLRFHDMFARVCTLVAAQISHTQAKLEPNFSQAPALHYPAVYLESILLNLLTNALKYKHPNRTPVIQLNTWLEAGDTLLEVSDNGVGIDLTLHGQDVFKMRKTFHDHPDSQGIGLFIVKNQVESQGGHITVTSTVGEGSTFRIVF